MITGAPAPSPTFLGSDSFLACGRLAFGCFRILTLGRVPLHCRPLPRTSHLVVASPAVALGLCAGASASTLAPGPAYFLSCRRLACGCPRILTLGRVPLHWRPDPRTSHLVVASPAVALGF